MAHSVQTWHWTARAWRQAPLPALCWGQTDEGWQCDRDAAISEGFTLPPTPRLAPHCLLNFLQACARVCACLFVIKQLIAPGS